ncbi:PREDICTED: uncharacterized protein LOC104791161 [Camelina sativa]|uniref:Uncharacterized protein LOC104791161 n=1 Tax=Camelina sativa TaxID=90675 RepID=A0ABM0ZG69_CAMSA|nr:PREDICTED: uncharacterized protein LOC104791161 [Camelina sativa]
MSIGGVPTAVFWDIVDCKIHDDLNIVEVTQNIKKTISEVGIDGTEVVSIRAYGEDDGKDHDFNSAGVTFTHSPAAARRARHNQILVDVLAWAEENPPPANLLLIMGDTTKEFENVILFLKSLNYRYLLAHP